MWKCKWSGDKDDVYCANCNGVTMEVDGKEISCEECNGYEKGSEEVDTETKEEKVVEEQKEPEKETPKDDFAKDMNKPEQDATTEHMETAEKPIKKPNLTNTTSKTKKAKESGNKKVEKVNEEKKAGETIQDVDGKPKVVALNYTSGATIKKGDNYFKFVAEEGWDVTEVKEEKMDDIREQLWAKLNSEVDKQIEELQNMN